jgi:predicted CXXCH cytochrome family protein
MPQRLTPSARTSYERPTLPYRCGRAANWDRPCWQGPAGSGRCGGTEECAPHRDGDRWQCRRPDTAGGACHAGPLPNGACPHQRPPCVPRSSLRRIRGQLNVLAVVVVIAALAAFADFDSLSSANANTAGQIDISATMAVNTASTALDPGPVANVHASFTAEQGCSACHQEHDLKGFDWLAAAFSSHDQTGQCLTCHEFAGAERAAHNRLGPAGARVAEPRCASCHTEHKGGKFPIATVSDNLCANCHEPSVSAFNKDHPVFPPDFPYQIPNNVNFDHAKHLGTYFVADSKWVKQDNRDSGFAARAKAACTTCHVVESATREVTPRPFEQTCAQCHNHQLVQRPLTVYRPGELTSVFSFALGLPADYDEDEGLEHAREFMGQIAQGGVDTLADALANRSNAVPAGSLLEGLDNTLLKAAAAAWSEEDGEFEAPEGSEADPGGWLAGEDDDGEQSLRYLPRRHSDPVLVAWVRYLRSSTQSKDPAVAQSASAALSSVLDDSTGPGACGKCHRAGLLNKNSAATELPTSTGSASAWRFTGPTERPHTEYSHGPHISILGPNVSCQTCHTLDEGTDYAAYFKNPADSSLYISNFQPIEKATCEQCHSEGRVTVACQSCHRYHRAASFKRDFKIITPHRGGSASVGHPPIVAAPKNT